MRCPSCGRSLTRDSRFCPGCGAAVAATCAGCGTELEADARFCRRCGRPVTDAAEEGQTAIEAALTGGRGSGQERKIATLLFADIVGFTSMNEAHDPELVSALVSRAFERLAAEVRRYEGTIEKFAGDAMLAVFGVPVAHEDDPERAVRAALEMQSVAARLETGAGEAPGLRLRIGIATGEVLVDQARASAERDLFVTGDAVNLAARLQAVAEPGTVVVDPSAYAATRDTVEYEELPAVALKGKSLPVAIWRAVAIKAGHRGQRARLGLESPLVGRDAEMALLKDTVRRVVEEGRPHLVTVMGSAGVGKSRLVWELEKYLDGLPELYHWRKGRCLAYSAQSFGPIADVVKADARIHDDDEPEVARTKLAARLEALPLGDDRDDIRDALEAVLAIGEVRERPRDELFEAWRRYLSAIAELQPLVLVVEDIHWADDGVLSLLDFLSRWAEGPMMILCLARHELLEKRSGWGGGLPNATTIVLEPLGEEASSALMAGLLDGGVPAPLADRITGLAEGNPLFVEEMVRMLVDRGVLRFADGRWELAGGVDQLEIPDSVQAVLAARLDTLPPDEKRVAQDAAVIGRIFWDVVVAHLVGSGRSPTESLIRRLRVKDLVVQRKPSSLANAGEYGFRHVLIRDVAYDSLPKRDRSRLHRDIALWAETELSDRIDEFSELIAGHLAAAVAYEEEFAVGDEDELRAIRQLARDAASRAAQRATDMSQMDSAGRWRKLELDLASKLDVPTREIARLTFAWADVAWETIEPAEREAVLAPAIAELEELDDRTADDDQLLAQLRDHRSNALYDAGDVEGARRLARDGIAALEPGPPTSGRALLLGRLGWTYWRAGPIEDSLPLLERALAEARASGSPDIERWVMHDLGVANSFLDRVDRAVDLLEESYRLAREAGDRALLMRCYINLPAVRQRRGDPTAPLAEMIDEGLGLARRSAASNTVAWLACNQGAFLTEAGRFDEALAYQDEGIAQLRILNAVRLSTQLRLRAWLHWLRGDEQAARSDVEEAERAQSETEPQTAEAAPVSRAWLAWATDPRGAMTGLHAWMTANPTLLGSPSGVAQELARMAMRLGDKAVVMHAVAVYRERHPTIDAPIYAARARWMEALVAGDHRPLEGVALVFEEAGYPIYAVDALADAAILAARAGIPSDAEQRALGLCRDMGMHPVLGSLPETRWLVLGSVPAD